MSDNGKHILVNIRSARRDCTSRMIIVEAKSRSIVKVADLDLIDQSLSIKLATGFWKQIGKHLVWVGLSVTHDYVHVFDFNVESGKLKELAEKRVFHKEDFPQRIHCLQNHRFYYTGLFGFIISLTLSH